MRKIKKTARKLLKKHIIKAMSFVLSLCLTFTVFSGIPMNVNSLEGAKQSQSGEILADENSKAEEKIEDTRYEEYVLSEIPEELKINEDVKNAVGLDTSDAEKLTSLTTINKDGSKSLKIYNAPIKYIEKSSGKVKFINNKIKKSRKINGNKKYLYENSASNIKTYFPENIEDGILVSSDDQSVEMTPINAKYIKRSNKKITVDEEGFKTKRAKKAKLKKDYAEYGEAFGKSTYIEYAPIGTGIKENIVLEKYTGQNEFSFILSVPGAKPANMKGKEILFVDAETGKEVFNINEIFAYDSGSDIDGERKECYNNSYKIEKISEGKYLLTSIIDSEFLKSKTTLYPVTIDPYLVFLTISAKEFIYGEGDKENEIEETIHFITTYNAFSDNTVTSSSQKMIVGGNKDGRVYVKTDFINDYTYINPNNIAAAHFETKATDITSNMTIKAYETKFGTSGLTATQAYNNCCNKLDGVISTNTLLKSQVLQNGQYDIDIKSIVKNWLKGALNESNASEDFGFVLMTTSESGEYKFGSTENSVIGMYPSISIDYREESVVSEDWHFLKNVGSGKYLVRSSDTGSAIDHGSEFMKFEITKYSEGTTVDGIYEISFETELARKYLYKTNSGVVFRFINPLTMGNDAYYTEVNSRHWRIVKNADGTVRIMNVDAPNMALTCNTNANSGNNVRLSEYSGNSSQKWRLYRANSKTGKYSVSAEEWPEDAATNQNLVLNDTPTLEYGTTLTSNVSGTGEVVVSGKTTMTDGIITNGNMDIYPNTLAQYDPDLKSFEAMKFLKPDGTYRDVGELYLDITFDLGSRYSLDKIYVASNTENNYYRTGAFEVYVSDNVSSLYDPRNRYVDFDNHLEKLDSAIIKVDFVDIAKGRYVGIRVTQGVIENYDWQPSHVDYAYVRMRGVAIFGSNIGPDDSVHTTEVMSVSDWPSSASTEQNLLSASGVTQTMKYGTMGLSNVEGERGATTYGKTSITDGDISCNMDIYWDGITQFDPENNSYRNLRFLNKSGVYRQPGELFLDITYDLGSVKNLGELWIATNTENNYYKTGVYEVYISNSLDDLYYTDNFYTSFDSRKEQYSGITKTIFTCGKEGRYLGIRITQGIINKPTTDPWSTSNITAAYARMRGVALFEYNLDDGETYRIVNTTSGFVLEVEGAGTESGTRIWQNNLDLEVNFQEFTFDYISNGEYKIKPKHADGMILGLNESSQVVLVEDSNANSSRWYIKSCVENEYTIVNKAHSGKLLSVGNQTEIETHPTLSTSNVGSIWVIKKFENNYPTYNSVSVGSSNIEYVEQGGEYWYTFTPPQTDYYNIYTTGSTDTYCELYRGISVLLETDADDGDGTNFKVTQKLFERTTYYFKIKGNSSSTSGFYSIEIESDFINQLQKLHDIAKTYADNDADAVELTMQFIRRGKYTGNYMNLEFWGLAAGDVDSEFVSYVQSENAEIYEHFTITKDLYWYRSNGEKIDIPHLAATYNIYHFDTLGQLGSIVLPENWINNLGGWAGDLRSIIPYIMRNVEYTTNYESIYNETIRLIGADDSEFSMPDLLSDVDAYNLYNSVDVDSLKMSFNNYYNNGGVDTRYTDFTNNWTKAEIFDLTKDMMTNTIINSNAVWPLKKINKSDEKTDDDLLLSDMQMNAICNAFTDFLWERIEQE